MIPEGYERIRQWLASQFPSCHGVAVSSANDAAALLPPGSPVSPYVTDEPVVLFRVVEEDRSPPWKELAIARPVLTGFSTTQILQVLEQREIARRLRVSPERRLFLDRQLQVDVLGTTWTETEAPGTPVTPP